MTKKHVEERSFNGFTKNNRKRKNSTPLFDLSALLIVFHFFFTCLLQKNVSRNYFIHQTF